MIGRMGVADLTPLAAAVLTVRPEPERVLEIGCGDGEATLFLAREFLHARIRGVDPSAEAVRAASARIGLDPEGRVAFKRGSARRLPHPDGNFDLVVQRCGRLHPGELARVLRPGGWLISGSRPRFGGLERRGFVAAAADRELLVMRLEDEATSPPRA
jgi:23S rRNA (guanine745-N1)-methyltransferase